MTKLPLHREDGTPIEWKQIKDFSRYLVSDDGRVFSTISDIIVSQRDNGGGYMQVYITSDKGKKKRLYAHRLVYATHKAPIPKGYEINHIDEDKANNDISNLDCVTPVENRNHGTRSIRAGKARRRAVAQYTLDGKLIRTYKSMTEADNHGYGIGRVCACCTGRLETYKGYKWKYA